jgi:hypothetical protein
MRIPQDASSTAASDRVSTREELCEVIELLGRFEQALDTELTHTADLIARMEANLSDGFCEPVEELTDDEAHLLLETEQLVAWRPRKSDRIN